MVGFTIWSTTWSILGLFWLRSWSVLMPISGLDWKESLLIWGKLKQGEQSNDRLPRIRQCRLMKRLLKVDKDSENLRQVSYSSSLRDLRTLWYHIRDTEERREDYSKKVVSSFEDWPDIHNTNATKKNWLQWFIFPSTRIAINTQISIVSNLSGIHVWICSWDYSKWIEPNGTGSLLNGSGA